MTTSAQILGLLKSHASGDEERFRALSLQLAAAEERRGHHKMADEIRRLANDPRSENPAAKDERVGGKPVPLARPRGELAGFMSASYPKVRLNHLVLPPDIAGQLGRIVQEQRQRWKLREHGLLPRQNVLLAGPPGSGKTMTAAALAGELGLPLFSVLLHGLITKFMGETAAKLRLVFDAVVETRGVYLFDEIDAIGGHRSSENDVGEARRILNSFLQFLDEEESESIIVATTNHRELLDRALFRRFHLLLDYKLPDRRLIIDTLQARLLTFDTKEVDWETVASAASGLSNADLIRAAEDAARQVILEGSSILSTERLVASMEERRQSVLGEADGPQAQPSTSHRSRARRPRAI